MLSRTAVFHLFLRPSDVPLCTRTAVPYPVIYRRTLRCFHVSATVNHAAVNIAMHVSLGTDVFTFLEKMPRRGIAGSPGIFIFSFFEERKLYQFTFPSVVHEAFFFFSPQPLSTSYYGLRKDPKYPKQP